jgi:hypothetical protein
MKDLGWMLILLALAASQPASWLGTLCLHWLKLLAILG